MLDPRPAQKQDWCSGIPTTRPVSSHHLAPPVQHSNIGSDRTCVCVLGNPRLVEREQAETVERNRQDIQKSFYYSSVGVSIVIRDPLGSQTELEGHSSLFFSYYWKWMCDSIVLFYL